MANSLWTFLNTDIKDLFSLDTVDEAADATGAVMALAETLGDENIQDIAPWVEESASLLDVLNSPEADLIESLLPFAKIATGLLKFYLTKSKQPLSFPDCVVLVGLKAYSESLRGFLVTYAPQKLNKTTSSSPAQSLKDFELSDNEAKQTLLCFHRSPLATHLNTLMCDRLQRAGLPESDAQRLCDRATWNTHRYITKAWSGLPKAKQRFSAISLTEWREEQEKYDSIDAYLKECVSPDPEDPARKMRWHVFNEDFTIDKLYVPLKGQPLTRNGDDDDEKDSIDLETWTKNLLEDSDKQHQVMFIQAGPGRGKSVFCRVFANKVREQLFPIWIPILIRLRDIPTLQQNFEETLRSAINYDFVKNDDGWLTDKNTRFLFFLDGFDELLMEGRTSGGLEQFLRQVGQFQKDCTSPEMGHRVIVTGRPLALHGVERTLPPNLERMRILPLGNDEQTQWFERWDKLERKQTAHKFLNFLQDDKCPVRLKGTKQEIGLAQEPLLLYLLAAMHRDGELNLETFEGADGTKAKVLIYQKSLDWVLTKQRSDLLNRDLTEFETDALYRILAESGLSVIQSGGECASISMIEERLKTDEEAKELLESAQARLKENPLRNALAAFYLQQGRKGEGSVEFAHKSFSEFLCAERIKQAIEDWTRKIEKRGRRSMFLVEEEQLYEEIYDLLGTPVLTEEIVEYLFVLLQSSEDFQPVVLFERLHSFYLKWCEGEFINRAPQEKNYSLQKMLQLQRLHILVGMTTVDVYAGLNVLIILFKLHASAQHPNYPNVPDDVHLAAVSFHPCREVGENTFNQDKLRNIIHYADSLGISTFTKIVGPHLSSVNLSGANLHSANLHSANLHSANLESAKLESANLYRAKLSKVKLSRAALSSTNFLSADLHSANLHSANLHSASLQSADLSGANLFGTNLSGANLSSADLSGVNFDSANLDRANLDRANLESANLYSANLESANLYRANLENADLSSAKLSLAKLSLTKLHRANLYRANLSSANLESVNLSSANLKSANLYRANLKGANLHRANLSNANLDYANLNRTNLDCAILLFSALQSATKLTVEQFTGEDPPLLCGATLPSDLINAGIDTNRDRNTLPEILSKSYNISLEEAQKMVDNPKQSQLSHQPSSITAN